MGRFSGDHGPPKIDGSFYAGPGSYDTYPTVPTGYAPTAAAAAAAAAAAGGASVVTGLREPYAATQGFQGMYACTVDWDIFTGKIFRLLNFHVVEFLSHTRTCMIN